MDVRLANSTNQSVVFALSTAGLTITDMKAAYVRYDNGDGTTFTASTPTALTELAAINTAHTDNYAKYLDTDATGGTSFELRVDFPDAAFATGDEVICNVYDDGNNVIGHRIFTLNPIPSDLTELRSDIQSAIDLKDFADAGYDPATNSVEQVKDVTNETTADMTKINGVAASAANLEQGAFALVTGSAITGTLTTTTFTTDLTEATDDHYNGRVVTFTSGALNGQSTDITDYTGSTKLVTVTAMTEAPSNTDTFVIS